MLSKCLTCHPFISSRFICWWAGASPRKWIQSMPGTARSRFIMVYLDPFSSFESTWSTIRHRGCSSLGLLRSTESILVAHLDRARSACARWTRVLSGKLLIEPTWLQSTGKLRSQNQTGRLMVGWQSKLCPNQWSTSIPYGSFFSRKSS